VTRGHDGRRFDSAARCASLARVTLMASATTLRLVLKRRLCLLRPVDWTVQKMCCGTVGDHVPRLHGRNNVKDVVVAALTIRRETMQHLGQTDSSACCLRQPPLTATSLKTMTSCSHEHCQLARRDQILRRTLVSTPGCVFCLFTEKHRQNIAALDVASTLTSSAGSCYSCTDSYTAICSAAEHLYTTLKLHVSYTTWQMRLSGVVEFCQFALNSRASTTAFEMKSLVTSILNSYDI